MILFNPIRCNRVSKKELTYRVIHLQKMVEALGAVIEEHLDCQLRFTEMPPTSERADHIVFRAYPREKPTP